MKKRLDFSRLDACLFDFDGVLTDNKVYVDQDGRETVCCSRKDGLAFELLRNAGLRMFIVSREENPVVRARAAKIKIPVVHGVLDKRGICRELAAKEGFSLKRCLFVGNDLNDYDVMRDCGYSACPSDSHPAIKKISKFVLKAAGGQGAVFELMEDIFGVDALSLIRKKGKVHA